ncbi:bifunctional metallophosphatase/5'-nucleotidase [Alkalicaulis satelles]|uniref:Bifunctional metallophosphatase/5'-nucleotidase n=1 Tax=Alkalicaulis satelles TaxID=2609175 RepID=A0A5M6ZBP7_9PROT|nr:5'-nucleotidase C-terminal domain-containing protein [Alkalicaulis satelles]KAA5802163.1 bifunctional metallophosphatase/5'-nucleotidase [Alkalicaulis satelles]
MLLRPLLIIPVALTVLIAAMSTLAACEAGREDGPAAAPGAEPFILTLLHINDHHSHLEPHALTLDPAVLGLEGEEPLTLSHGGFPLLTPLFAERARASEAVLTLHAGDAMTGTLYYTLFEGEADAALMNRICFDAFVLGNHEFDHGDAGLVRFLDFLDDGACETAILSANTAAHDASPLIGRYQPSAVFERAGRRIGVIGLTIAEKTKISSSPDPDTQFLDETQSAQAEIDRLRSQGVTKIILLTHSQYERERAMARALSGVDVIVGGDSHTLLGDAAVLAPLGFSPDGPYPTLETNADGDPVCVVQAFEYARVMGELQVSFDDQGRVIACSGTPRIPVDASEADETLTAALAAHSVLYPVTPDADSAALLANFSEALDELRQNVIGEAGENLCMVRLPGEGRAEPLCARAETYAQGSHVSALVAEAFLQREGGADIALQNAGGVRASIAAGPVTIADIFTVLPFANTLHVLELSGAEILETLDAAVGDAVSGGGAYPYAAGLRFTADLSAEPGARVRDVEVNPRLAGDWGPIDPEARYRVVTNSFIAGGGDGYQVFARASAEGRVTDTFAEYAQSFVNYVRALSEAGEALNRPAPERMSTQRFISADGCDHAETQACE